MARRVAIKNQIKAMLRGLGITLPQGSSLRGSSLRGSSLRGSSLRGSRSLWTKKGIAWLKELASPSPLDDANALCRDLLVQEMSELGQKIKRLEQELAKRADRHPAVRLLMTIPGVGIRTAEAVVAYIDDINRFGKMAQLGTYFGLVPCQDASASINRLGHITKEGPATVRKLLCQASWQAIRRSPKVRSWFERIVGKDSDRRKIAAVAVARKLVVIMGAMLRSGQAWRE